MEVKKSFFTTFSHSFELSHVEDVSCNLCGSDRYRHLTSEFQFDIRECRECGLIYVTPQPAREELPQFYAGMYSDGSKEDIALRSLGYIEGHLSGIVKRRKPEGGRLLEIGSGYGNFLKAVAAQPWQATGLEISANAIAHARQLVPTATFIQTTLEEAEIAPASQDCVVLIAVLEHVKNPTEAIARITRWLAPGGLLLIQVPYVGAFIKLKRWIPWLPIHFEAPRHLFDFSPKTLPEYLRRAVYEDIRVEIARPYSCASRTGVALIWAIKLIGLALYYLSGRRYVYPYASAITVHAVKPEV